MSEQRDRPAGVRPEIYERSREDRLVEAASQLESKCEHVRHAWAATELCNGGAQLVGLRILVDHGGDWSTYDVGRILHRAELEVDAFTIEGDQVLIKCHDRPGGELNDE